MRATQIFELYHFKIDYKTLGFWQKIDFWQKIRFQRKS